MVFEKGCTRCCCQVRVWEGREHHHTGSDGAVSKMATYKVRRPVHCFGGGVYSLLL